MDKYVVAVDQGTTSCRALVIAANGDIVSTAQEEFTQIFPKPGWVEHDAEEIVSVQERMIREAVDKARITSDQIDSVGITNQRETTVVWNKETGKPVYNAIVWQDKRTAHICEQIKSNGWSEEINVKTGLVVDSYFSATKIMWILEHVEGARALADKGLLAMGTMDTWLIHNLTGGNQFVTDYSNASRTMLYNIYELEWDEWILDQLQIPRSMLPAVKPSSYDFGHYELDGIKIPIRGVAGDQQAALFGQQCLTPGMAKNTYGTGCFMLMQTGEEAAHSKNGLLTTIAWGLNGKVYYALEGSVFIAGAAVQWLRDGLKLFAQASESEQLAQTAQQDHGIFVVPAFSGLGAPYWDMYARGAIFGLTRDAGIPEITRATL
ncbi:MAG: glycerol kinase GlpK, partial [Saprospiraceae bacterium]|nr:glycerol kinase GlpK [Saprospiraceae bacterium]